jgi:hypothetical protein
MKINKLSISRGFFSPLEITFEKNTVITSDTNAKGKTTLLRFLLHAMGYKIPSTKKVDMKGHQTILEVANSKEIMIIKREDDSLTIKYSDNHIQEFDLKEDRNRLIVQSIIFNTENYDFLRNLLMIIYIDQDKGWTLLNRGKAIGNNRFDVNDFIASLSGIDVGKINAELKNIDAEIKKYNALKKIISLKDDFTPIERNKNERQNDIEEKNRLLVLKTELLNKKQQIDNKIRGLERIQKNNKEMIDYIVSYNLLVKHKNGDQFILSENDIVDFDVNQNILEFQIKSEYFYLTEVKRDIVDIDAKLKVYAQLFDVEQNTSNIINAIIVTDVDTISIERVLSSLGKQKSALKKQKNDKVSSRNELINKAMKLVEDFSRRLGVYEELIGTENNYLFTSNLKEYSGSILHKIVFSFRLAFNIVASEIIGVKLPFIIDSPGSAELTIDNIRELISLAKDNLPESQIIISTIYSEVVDIFDKNLKNIHLSKMLLDNDVN